MMSMPALAVAFVVMTVLIGIIIYQDLKNLRIPNWSVLAIFVLFLITGAWGLPFDVYLWRILYAFVALGLGIGLYAIAMGAVGAGDLKMLAALIPFVNPPDAGFVALLYVAATFLGLIARKVVRSALAGRETGWKSVDQPTYFPLGLLLGATIVVYLGYLVYGQMG